MTLTFPSYQVVIQSAGSTAYEYVRDEWRGEVMIERMIIRTIISIRPDPKRASSSLCPPRPVDGRASYSLREKVEVDRETESS